MSKFFDYIMHGGDEADKQEATLEYTEGVLARSIEIAQELEAENARLRAALEFYADPARWMKVNNITDEQIPDFYDETNFGERALLALNQQYEEKK